MCVQTYLVDAYGLYAASALAANTVVRSLVGAFLPFAAQPMYDALGIGWGTSALAFIALAFMPCPMLFYVYGERIRRRFAREVLVRVSLIWSWSWMGRIVKGIS